MLPAFRFRVIKDLYPVFWGKAVEMVDLLKQEISAKAAKEASDAKEDNTATIQTDNWATRVTLDIIGLAGFSSEFNSLSTPDTPLNKAYRGAFLIVSPRQIVWAVTQLCDTTLMFKLPTARMNKLRDGISHVTGFIRDILEDRRAELIENKDDPDSLKKIAKKDVISTAMCTGNFTTENLVDQSKTILGAGHETNAISLTWAVWLLTRPKYLYIQDRLREEVRAKLPSPESGIPITSDLLDSLPYLDAVSKEVYRVYAPFQSIGRVAKHDTELGGVHIPRGTTVRACPYAVNKNRKLWGEDAREFRPERWLEGENKKNGGADHLSFITFSHGSRDCLGKSKFLKSTSCISLLINS